MQEFLDRALRAGEQVLDKGKVASYIPELNKANPRDLGVYVRDTRGRGCGAGQFRENFTIQSIAKVAALLLALDLFGHEEVFARVGMEPSGLPFSEFAALDDFSGKPSNPFINSGAIVISSLLASQLDFACYLSFLRKLCKNPALDLDEAVFVSELAHSERNHSLAWELKRLKLLSSDLDVSLEFYTRLCAIKASAQDLAEFGLCLAEGGQNLAKEQDVATCLSLMFTCGLYDGSGNFAVEAGLPAKSGVGGGILAVAPGKYGIACYGPSLDSNGNSIGGIKILEVLSKELKLHCFIQNGA